MKKFQYIVCLFLVLFLIASCDSDNQTEASSNTVENPLPKQFTSFAFLAQNNQNLTEDVSLEINGNSITGRIANNIAIDNLVASFSHTASNAFVGPTLQTSATTANDFSTVVTYIVEASDNTRQNYYIDITKFTGLPIVYINTLNAAEITSKDEYISATISIDGNRNYRQLENTAIRIRGRGNSTWAVSHPKKPYQIRFNDKTSILGMPEDRRWLLLAEYSDKSMMRNKVVHTLALGSSTNLVWTATSEYARSLFKRRI